jgi:hypothetical protein
MRFKQYTKILLDLVNDEGHRHLILIAFARLSENRIGPLREALPHRPRELASALGPALAVRLPNLHRTLALPLPDAAPALPSLVAGSRPLRALELPSPRRRSSLTTPAVGPPSTRSCVSGGYPPHASCRIGGDKGLVLVLLRQIARAAARRGGPAAQLCGARAAARYGGRAGRQRNDVVLGRRCIGE